MWRRRVADIHLWLSLVVGLQVLAWIASGLFMSAVPFERVQSRHRMVTPPTVDLGASGPLVPLESVLRVAGAPVRRVTLEQVGGIPAYLAETAEGRRILIEARTGRRLSPLDAALARAIAEAAVAGDDAAERVARIERNPPIEYRGDLPAWRVDFGGADHLSVFVAADTGAVTARSDLWRAYDLFWALHIMDYREREDFQHPLLICFAAGALLMSIAGGILLFLRLPPRLRGR